MTEPVVDAGNAGKLLALLGLARRAGSLAVGMSAVEKMVRRGDNPVVVVAADMGPGQRSKVDRWQPVRAVVDGPLTTEQLAAALGRDKLAVVAVAEMGFVKGILKLGS